MLAYIADCGGAYGDSFQPDLGHLLLGLNDKTLSVASYIDCLNACIDEPSFTCRTAEMYLTEMTCYLSTTTVAMQPESHVADATFDLYQRDCVQTV